MVIVLLIPNLALEFIRLAMARITLDVMHWFFLMYLISNDLPYCLGLEECADVYFGFVQRGTLLWCFSLLCYHVWLKCYGAG